ncbi:Carotenoid 9,10(9',10')-cleavage dioxygenase 1 [Acorus calamus]|uniref:Carotenoid 9,10(9',10')-cleavage dioxygenase 1 n=1 Tax=Acorus calamus TaxID=4465 RepID=A0AAV9CLZ3_ACOCL|nr:Carotenoid 9,10(9',10')-cleavage dioxygenase 1 [Acorus calamus]
MLRFGKVNKDICNTNVFEHSGKVYSIAENYLPQEIDIFSLNTHGNWDVNGSWDRCFTAHPKRAPGTGELVITGVDAVKPFLVLGVVSADGKRLVHKVDLKLERSIICHEIGVTEQYNVIMDIPLVVDINRLVQGGPLIKYEKDGYARIGVMPRYGDSESIMWFDVQPHCIFHISIALKKVVVRGFRQLKAIIPGPDFGHNKFEWFSRGFKPINDESIEDGSFFSRLHEWRLNMVTGEAKERRLTGDEFSMDFPMINENYIGSRNNYGYAQVADSNASSSCALPKYGGVAKLCLEDQNNRISKNGSEEEMINLKYHKIGEKQFCTGAAFVARNGGLEEDDGWIVTFVHSEETNVSQVHIIDTKKFDGEAIVKITLPQRVPYGFHGTFISTIPKNV